WMPRSSTRAATMLLACAFCFRLVTRSVSVEVHAICIASRLHPRLATALLRERGPALKKMPEVFLVLQDAAAHRGCSHMFSRSFEMAQRLRVISMPGSIAGALPMKGNVMNWDRVEGNWKQ